MTQINDILINLAVFRDARGWHELHTMKNLSMALMCEAAELQELFLWDKCGTAEDIDDEMADCFIYLFNMCLTRGLTDNKIIGMIQRKIEKNRIKYPVKNNE